MPRCLASAVLAAGLLAGCGGPHPAAERPAPAAPNPPGGRVAWRWSGEGAPGVPAADGRAIVLTVGRRTLVMLDGRGRTRWQVAVPDGRDVAPLLTADTVVVPTEAGLAAFARAGGARRWAAGLGDRTGTPVATGGLAVATLWHGGVAAVDLATGATRWRAPLPGLSIGPPAVAGGVVVAVWERPDGTAGAALGLDVATGAVRWSRPLPAPGLGAPGAVRDTVFVVAGDRRVHALGAVDGTERWATPVLGRGAPETPVVAAGDAVVALTAYGSTAVLDAATGRMRWQTRGGATVFRGAPVVLPAPGPLAVAVPVAGRAVSVATADDRPRLIDPRAPVSGLALGPGGRLLVPTGTGLLAYEL